MNISEKIQNIENKDLKKFLLNNSKDCFVIKELIEEDYEVIGNSRIGGIPDLPKHWKYPVNEEFYLSFIAQINLADLEKVNKSNLPKKGWLYFFLGEDEQTFNLENKVLYFDGNIKELEKTLPPEDLDEAMIDDRFFVAHKVKFELDKTITWNEDTKEYLQKEIGNEMFKFAIERTEIIGNSFNQNNKNEALICMNEIENILYEFFKNEIDFIESVNQAKAENDDEKVKLEEQKLSSIKKYNELLPKKDEWQFLFQIKSNNEIEMEWWDAGLLNFLIKRSDLIDENFDEVYACISTS